MSSGLYDMSEKNFDKTLDLTMLKPYIELDNYKLDLLNYSQPLKELRDSL